MRFFVTFLLSIARNRTGTTSMLEALVGGAVALLVVWADRKLGLGLDKTDIAAVSAAGPAISSYLAGTVRHYWVAAKARYTEITNAFQRGVSDALPK